MDGCNTAGEAINIQSVFARLMATLSLLRFNKKRSSVFVGRGRENKQITKAASEPGHEGESSRSDSQRKRKP